MTIVMQYAGVPGESKITGFEKYIELEACQWGVGRMLGSSRGTSKRESGQADFADISCVKQTDGSTIKLFEQAITGDMDKKIDIKFLRTGQGQPQEFLSIELNGGGIANMSFSASGGQNARPTESLTLTFDKISLKYTPIGDDLTGSPASYGWDLALAKKL